MGRRTGTSRRSAGICRVVGRATGTSQITGMSIISTQTENSVLTVRNPSGNAAALTITPLGGGTRPISAHLMITQLG